LLSVYQTEGLHPLKTLFTQDIPATSVHSFMAINAIGRRLNRKMW
jgi:hypothetical protein